MAVGKKKAVRWTIPDAKAGPPRGLEARTPGRPSLPVAYPSVAELVSGGTYTRGWLDAALRSVVGPVAVASALSLGATGCADVAALLAGDGHGQPAPAAGDADAAPWAVLTPLDAPGGPGGPPSGALPTPPPGPRPAHKPPPSWSRGPDDAPSCALTAPPTIASANPRPSQAHPPNIRGGRRPVRPPPPPPPPITPAVDPPALDGEVAVVRPDPPPMPGGLRAVRPVGDGGT